MQETINLSELITSDCQTCKLHARPIPVLFEPEKACSLAIEFGTNPTWKERALSLAIIEDCVFIHI